MTVSIIIPALDSADTIGAQLEAIAAQRDDDLLEVIVADNGSTDGTEAVAASFAGRLPVQVIDASSRRGPGAARNQGATAARGDVLLFCDSDDVVMPGWKRAMTDCIGSGRVAVGVIKFIPADTAAIDTTWTSARSALPRYLGQVTLTYSSNLGLSRSDFESVGGFDETLRCGEDADLGIRLSEAGCELCYCPAARVVMRDRGSSRGQFLQFIQYGRWDVAVYRKHRGRALRRPPLADAIREWGSLLVHVPWLLDRKRRRSWVTSAGQRIGRLVGSVRERTFLP